MKHITLLTINKNQRDCDTLITFDPFLVVAQKKVNLENLRAKASETEAYDFLSTNSEQLVLTREKIRIL